MTIEITCCNCLEKFDEFSGNIDERMCMTCILINEEPDIIKPRMIKVPDVHRRGYIIKKDNYKTKSNCLHPPDERYYQQAEPKNNVSEDYYCLLCNKQLPFPEPIEEKLCD